MNDPIADWIWRIVELMMIIMEIDQKIPKSLILDPDQKSADTSQSTEKALCENDSDTQMALSEIIEPETLI
jgi:hypothetical protein